MNTITLIFCQVHGTFDSYDNWGSRWSSKRGLSAWERKELERKLNHRPLSRTTSIKNRTKRQHHYIKPRQLMQSASGRKHHKKGIEGVGK
jgi:hypothetical protein